MYKDYIYIQFFELRFFYNSKPFILELSFINKEIKFFFFKKCINAYELTNNKEYINLKLYFSNIL